MPARKTSKTRGKRLARWLPGYPQQRWQRSRRYYGYGHHPYVVTRYVEQPQQVPPSKLEQLGERLKELTTSNNILAQEFRASTMPLKNAEDATGTVANTFGNVRNAVVAAGGAAVATYGVYEWGKQTFNPKQYAKDQAKKKAGEKAGEVLGYYEAGKEILSDATNIFYDAKEYLFPTPAPTPPPKNETVGAAVPSPAPTPPPKNETGGAAVPSPAPLSSRFPPLPDTIWLGDPRSAPTPASLATKVQLNPSAHNAASPSPFPDPEIIMEKIQKLEFPTGNKPQGGRRTQRTPRPREDNWVPEEHRVGNNPQGGRRVQRTPRPQEHKGGPTRFVEFFVGPLVAPQQQSLPLPQVSR